MSIVRNGTPWHVMYGVDDQSVPPLSPERAGSPIHSPLMFTFSGRGDPNEAYAVAGDSLFEMFGRDVLDPKSPYATFNTPLMELFNRRGNTMFVQRLVPEDAATASMRLYAEVLPNKVPNYVRNEDGSIKLDENGFRLKDGDIDGIEITWRVAAIDPSVGGFRAGAIMTGTQTNAGGETSTIYPIMDFDAPYPGAVPNSFGLRLWCPNAKSDTPLNTNIVSEIGARLLTVQFLEQTVPGNSPSLIRTLTGQTSVSFSLKPGAYYRPMRMELDFDEVVLPAYRKLDVEPGFVPKLGPVREIYLYRDNLETVLDAGYAAINNVFLDDKYEVDIFSGMDVYGHPYNGIVVDNGLRGGVILSDWHVHYLQGGSDGTLGNDKFDELVQQEMIEFGSGKVNYLNILRYPVRQLWDTGFSVDTKEAMCNFIGRLKTTNLCLSTHVYNQGVNDMQTEEAMKVALSSMLRAHPDSLHYGTGCLRGWVVGHSMRLYNSVYKSYVPVAYALARMVTNYAGAGIGRFNPAYKFSRGELTVTDDGYDFNLRYKPQDVYSSDWETGLISLRSYDQHRYHFPGLYTAYENDRSICNNLLVSIIVAHLNFLAHQVWAEITGVSDMTDGEIIQMVNDKMVERTEGIYDGAVQIVPNAYFSAEDKNNGYSISLNIELYGAVIKTVLKTTITAYRFQEE